ncbi:MbtH family NRPS accessory protein [Streptomyces sp. SID685]|uniref:MbtH family protein n=1 Tax=Streptomyces TaxID=1883 RepID=UPI00136BB9D7|nr:MbtH family protein [Streptomyces sp. SID685]MYR85247.1 MbtH family NRPS accessory protein [Streptomyces sp. SID685]
MSAFEDEQRSYLVLRNDAGHQSLWPAGTDVPSGWQTVHGPVGRADCLGYLETGEPSTGR